MCFRGGLIADSPRDGPVNFPPQLDDHGIGIAPGVHQRLEFLLLKPHFDSAHGLERAHGAAIAQCQFRNFAFLAQMPVDTMLFYRHAEHLAGGSAVDVLAFGEHLLPPLFPG